MRRIPVLALALLLAGCPLTPILNETTPPNLYFTVWYENASHNSNSDELGPIAAFNIDVQKCIFVASPFLVRVMGSDPGGVAILDVANRGNNSLRVIDAQTKASPPPGSPTQTDPVLGGPFPNPGSPFGAGANASILSYFDPVAQTGGPVSNVATLEVAFEFAPGQPASGDFLVEARNASDQLSRLSGYHVQLAGSASNQQPGMPCAVPAANARRR
ncbi:MAG TPA: hypothetical protein VFK92_07455 [Burkholderiales bacterium]|nr:hypothetical protein [Burkholderiales bacterium]